jgi:WD40 repeat protein
VQLWNLRKPGVAMRKFTGHNGTVLGLDFHPTNFKYLASGGRDRTVKVWDTDSYDSKPVRTIQTIDSVARVAWRPNHPDHLATTSSLIDCNIHVWNILRPYIPIASFPHSDVVTSALWLNNNNKSTESPTWYVPQPAASSSYPPSVTLANSSGEHGIGQEEDDSACSPFGSLLSCTKDGRVILHHVENAIRPAVSLRTTGAAYYSILWISPN